ncbi:MAG: DMT family transporter [Hahellaceae bacterium]|nr:DMT family transporter [Hahellaceae bacterium]
MGKLNSHLAGAVFALAAAAMNGSIGVISKVLLSMGISPSSIAFVKTIIGGALLSILLIIVRNSAPRIPWRQAAICAFFGIFTLFFFETAAYQHESAANVVFTLMAFAAFSALILSWVVLGDKPQFAQWFGFMIAIVGVGLIVGVRFEVNIEGMLLAAIAGSGYGLFSVLVKKFKLEGGLVLTRQLLFFGSMFLLLPAAHNGFEPELQDYKAVAALVALAILPTVLGFFCTTKAIDLLPPSQVQILELSEPLFAAGLAFLIINERPGIETFYGGALIITGLIIANEVLKFGSANSKPIEKVSSVSK